MKYINYYYSNFGKLIGYTIFIVIIHITLFIFKKFIISF